MENSASSVEVTGKDRAPSKEERKLCWDSRDAYWKCMDRHGQESDKCRALRERYEVACPAQWVKHFDRKYQYEQYKKKLETEGHEPIYETKAS